MKTIGAFLSGLIFGIGLLLSGMTDPAKVQSFLDLAGLWDPSLALVMGAALSVATPLFVVVMRRAGTLSGEALCLPANTKIDRRLVFGSLVFGACWGLAGFCPGPALASLTTGAFPPGSSWAR